MSTSSHEGDSAAVDGALATLRHVGWYPFNAAQDRELLQAAFRVGIPVDAELNKWLVRAEREPPRLPRAALKAWLQKARGASQEATEAAAARERHDSRPPRSPKEILDAKLASSSISSERYAQLLSDLPERLRNGPGVAGSMP